MEISGDGLQVRNWTVLQMAELEAKGLSSTKNIIFQQANYARLHCNRAYAVCSETRPAKGPNHAAHTIVT